MVCVHFESFIGLLCIIVLEVTFFALASALAFFFSCPKIILVRAAHGCKGGVGIISHGFSELFLRISWVDSPGVH